MDLVVIILSVFVVLLLVAITVILVVMTKQKDELQKSLDTVTAKNSDLQKRLDNFTKKTQALAISYKTSDPKIQQIADSMRSILEILQKNIMCSYIRKNLSATRENMFNKLKSDIEKNNRKCSDIKMEWSMQAEANVDNPPMINKKIPAADQAKLKEHINTILNTGLAMMCTNDKLDIEKVKKFYDLVIDTICYEA